MAIKQLTWQEVQPNLENIVEILNNLDIEADFLCSQPRIRDTLSLFTPQIRRTYQPRFMLLKAPESPLIFSLLNDSIKKQLPDNHLGFAYHFNENKITLTSAKSKQDNFSATDCCLSSLWVDNETLFGCVRKPDDNTIKLEPGLIHRANGGILILSLRNLLSQPAIWSRLKQMVIDQTYEWFSTDDANPLPFNIPAMPLDLRIILVGDRLCLADLQDYEPEFYNNVPYAEFENELSIKSEKDIKLWTAYIKSLAKHQQLPEIENTAFTELLKTSIRYTEDQYYLPLSPDWLNNQLVSAAQFANNDRIDTTSLQQSLKQKMWREGYLIERFRDAIFTNQVAINTRDQIVGQINGLSVVEYPGYPHVIGEPLRLSCLIHAGDGELMDIERKNDLAGNIHSKGMMIMQSFITSEFALNSPLPYSASIVFEQSYNEVDGDSASLAGLCVLISALSGQPIDQQLAVTGSVDQFGNVQAIGSLNEKIEGFYAVCKHQGLTGQQGVIIPAINQRHLCLSDEIADAIKNEQFSILTVDHVSEALHLLTGIPYKNDSPVCLYRLIQSKILSSTTHDKMTKSWLSKWFK